MCEPRKDILGCFPRGPFWYVNANGLVKLAVNGGRAADTLVLEIGCAFEIVGDK
ncbi:MAG: SAM hydroxide adenosyltransferase [Rhodospirillaceae bacterium]